MSIFWYLGFFILALGVLITVHEFGHYLVARACGVKVLRFSIGFGKPLAIWRRGPDQTEWVLAAIPLGGFVRMLDETEGEVAASERARAFNTQPVGKRFAIVAAGPIANFLLAIVVYWAVFMGGVDELKAVVDEPARQSPAAQAGLVRGDRVSRVGEAEIATWQGLRWQLLEVALKDKWVKLTVERPGETSREVVLDLSSVNREKLENDFLTPLGLRPERLRVPAVIGGVVGGSVAERAGLKVGDEILAINERAVGHWGEVVDTIQAAPGQALRIEYRRGGERAVVDVVPAEVVEGERKIGRIGVGPRKTEQPPSPHLTRVSYGPIEAMSRALALTWDTTRLSLTVMWRMLTGEVSARNLSGPLTIADYAGQTAAMGPGAYIRFIALVSISIAVLNLLPIPVLDGGHLMYYFIEIIKGGPVSETARQLGQKIGFALLMMLMAFAFYNDITRLFSG